jgi:hypothetical protein
MVPINRILHLHDLALWLNTVPIRKPVNAFTAASIYTLPLIQWIHILGSALICGTVIMIGLRMMGLFSFSPPLADLSRRLLPWAWLAIVINIITGMVMVIDRPTRALDSFTFPYSVLFVIVGTVLSIYFAITLRIDPGYWDRPGGRRTASRVLGTLTVLLWVGVIVGDRLIVYTAGAR